MEGVGPVRAKKIIEKVKTGETLTDKEQELLSSEAYKMRSPYELDEALREEYLEPARQKYREEERKKPVFG